MLNIIITREIQIKTTIIIHNYTTIKMTNFLEIYDNNSGKEVKELKLS